MAEDDEYETDGQGIVELEAGEDLTDDEVDAIAETLVEGLIADVGRNKAAADEAAQYETERVGGFFGWLGGKILGQKVPKTATEKFTNAIKGVLIWGTILAGIVVAALVYFRKGKGSGF